MIYTLLILSGISNILLLAQSVAPEATILPPIERLTLSGALITAVAVLWRSKSKSDDSIITINKNTVEALVNSSNTAVELRSVINKQIEINEGILDTLKELKIALENVHCLNPPEQTNKMRGI